MARDTSSDTPHWKFCTSNAVWCWSYFRVDRWTRVRERWKNKCECVKTGEEDCYWQWAIILHFSLWWIMNESQLWKCLEHNAASFPAWCSRDFDKKKTVKLYFSLSTESCQFPYFITPDSALIFDKGHRSAKTADVSNLRESPLWNISTCIKCNRFPNAARLITQWENLLWSRFITGERSCLEIFYFTVRHYW